VAGHSAKGGSDSCDDTRADVPSVEPDLVSNFKWRRGLGMLVVVLLILLLGMLQVVTKDFMKSAELLDEGFSSGINQLRRHRNGNKIAGMVALVGEEWSELCRLVLCIVVNEFSISSSCQSSC